MSDTDTLGTRHPDSVLSVIDERPIPYLELTRLYDFHLVAYGRVDRAIITAMVERWCQETHTFHLPLGEATITLCSLTDTASHRGHGSIFLSANLTELLVVVMLLLRNNPHQMLNMVHGGILHARRASTPGLVSDSTKIS